LRKKTTPELNINKKLRKVDQQISYENLKRDPEMKEELHQEWRC